MERQYVHCSRQRSVIYALFILNLQPVDGQCSSNYTNLTATESYQWLNSPGYPSGYGSNLDCGWYIRAENSSHVIRFEVLDLSTDDSGICLDDYIRIYNGPKIWYNSVGIYCGTKKPDPFVSISDLVSVFFRTDSSAQAKGTGFMARYISGQLDTFYDYDDSDDTSQSSSNSTLYIILGSSLGSVVVLVIGVVISVKIYRHIKAKNSRPRSRPQRRIPSARVYPHDSRDIHNNRFHNNYIDLPPAYSEINARPRTPPPRYTMFDTSTFR